MPAAFGNRAAPDERLRFIGAGVEVDQLTTVAIDLTAPVGPAAGDSTPLWERAVAAVVNTLGGTRDVLAATR